MKKILFAMAVLAALASCQKADLAEQNSVNTNGERVITAYFDNAGTKTTLDGVTPKWTGTETIMLLDKSGKYEIKPDEIVVSTDGTSITFTTSLEGPLYAVYPSTAAGAEEIEFDDIVPVTLSAEDQDGTFASANICVAKEDDGKLAFKNVTSVLHLTQTLATTNVNEIIITTPSAYIAGTGTVDMRETTPTLALSSAQSKKIKVKSASAKSDYYIAVAPTTLPAGTAFGFATGSELGGTNLSEERAIVANTIYNIGSMDATEIAPHTYHDYVEIGGLKWATMNIGATTIKGYGEYFAWGAAEMAYSEYRSDTFTFLSSRPSSYGTGDWDIDWGFWYKNTPYCTGAVDDETGVYSKYTGSDSKDVLEPMDDAAHCIWGSTWRMPTGGDGGEFDALCEATYWKWDDTDEGFYVYVPNPSTDAGKYDGNGTGTEYIKSDALLFFPAANQGYSCYNYHSYYPDDPVEGYYWASTLGANFLKPSEDANLLYFKKGFVGPNYGMSRYFGRSIRPVSD